MSRPHKFQFFRNALRQLRAARAIADPAIARAHRRLAALYVERGASIGRIGPRAAPSEASNRGAGRREARS